MWVSPFCKDTPTAPIPEGPTMMDLPTWTNLVDNRATTAPYLREFYISGDQPLPTANTFTWKGTDYTINKDYVFNFDIIDANQANYDFVRQTGCQIDVWAAWDTDGGSLLGFVRATLNIDPEFLRGDTSLETYRGSLTWTHTCPPPRYDSPFAT